MESRSEERGEEMREREIKAIITQDGTKISFRLTLDGVPHMDSENFVNVEHADRRFAEVFHFLTQKRYSKPLEKLPEANRLNTSMEDLIK
jgi:hypothetical protein